MKTLTLSALLCAMIALTRVADTEAGQLFTKIRESRVDLKSISCPSGWTAFNDRCFRYVPRSMSWAAAERNCMSMGGHLASVQNIQEYQEIQAMILSVTENQGVAWIGGSNAEEEQYWFWSDGKPFNFTHWCDGQPDNTSDETGHQHCLQMNYSDLKCWDDTWCHIHLPSVCAM